MEGSLKAKVSVDEEVRELGMIKIFKANIQCEFGHRQARARFALKKIFLSCAKARCNLPFSDAVIDTDENTRPLSGRESDHMSLLSNQQTRRRTLTLFHKLDCIDVSNSSRL
jgi:hypothetical protein